MGIHYLQSQNQPDLQQEIKNWLGTFSKGSSFLLILDGTVLNYSEYLKYQNFSLINLYKNTDFETMGNYGIQALYFELDECQDEDLDKAIEYYAKISNGKPTFSIAKLNNSFNMDFWLWLLDVHIENDSQYYINRFADTHTLANFYKILNNFQRSYIGKYIVEWGIKDRDGNWKILFFDNEKTDKEIETALILSEQQVDNLFDLSEADMIYAELSKNRKLKMYFPLATKKYEHINILLKIILKTKIETYVNKLFFIEKFIEYSPAIFDNNEVRRKLPLVSSKNDIESILK